MAALPFIKDPRVFTLLYEDLVANPIPVMTELMQFLDARTNEDIIRTMFKMNSTSSEGTPDYKGEGRAIAIDSNERDALKLVHDKLRDFQSKKPIFDDSRRWARDPMPKNLIKLFRENAKANELLKYYGYWDGKTKWWEGL